MRKKQKIHNNGFYCLFQNSREDDNDFSIPGGRSKDSEEQLVSKFGVQWLTFENSNIFYVFFEKLSKKGQKFTRHSVRDRKR